ncbi:MAG: hypothetical protein IK095_03335 [Oscillospiraceae bacterium]|nr:hypothetical protein [Oscillospiraceae bacterium]
MNEDPNDNDLIYRRDAIAAIYAQHVGGREAVEKARPNTFGADLRDIAAEIADIPAAVVTCSSCRYWEQTVPRSEFGEPGLGICRAHSDRGLNEPYIVETCDTDFCQDSERKEQPDESS